MVMVTTEYQGKSQVTRDADGVGLALSTNQRRPVRLHGRVVRHAYPLRVALETLGELVWSDFQWLDEDAWQREMDLILDPVITVHRDRVFFEAFNQDQSAYGLVIADRGIFEDEGETICGTTNVDFTRGLWTAVRAMRSREETWFRVGPSGFGVSTGGGGQHFEEKVEVPREWVRGLLQLQTAMGMPGTRVTMSPVDVASVVRFLRANKAYESPRSLRFEFRPGEDTRLVLEPWEEVVELPGAAHRYIKEKVTRIWGRRRLTLIEGLLPFASQVQVYLKGRGLPSFWAVEMPGVTFVLGMSGWTGNNWTKESSFDLMLPESVSEEVLERVMAALAQAQGASAKELAAAAGADLGEVTGALGEACRRGRAIYDVQSREYRHRELFEEPIEVEEYFPRDPRREAGRRLLEAGEVEVLSDEFRVGAGSTRGREGSPRVFADRHVEGRCAGEEVRVVLRTDGGIIFGRCSCEFFDENLMGRGPCEHMVALRGWTEAQGSEVEGTSRNPS